MTYPLSQTQMGIYVTCITTQEEGNYNIDMLYTLDDDVDIERLAAALDKVIEAHPYVKSRLVTNDEGEVVFEDHSSDEFHTSIFEVDDIEEARSHLGEDYDLTPSTSSGQVSDQLFRLEIYKTLKGNYLYVDFHHIIFDGMSFVNFTNEVSRAYTGEAPLGEEINGFEIAQAEIALRQSQEYHTAKEWYQTEYAEAAEVESTPIPDVYPSICSGQVPDEHFVDITVPLNIDGGLLSSFCKRLDVRESILLTAAFGYMLAKYSADDKVLFNTLYHGRTDRRTRKSFCMMVQTLPVFLDLTKSASVQELLSQLQTQISTARNNSGYSYGEVCADLGLKSEVCFAYQGSLNSFGLTLDGRPQQEEYLYKHHPGIQISIRLVVEHGQYKAKIDYPAHKYSKEMTLGMMVSFCNIVSEICQKDLLSDIEICDSEQIAQLDSFNHPIPEQEEETVLGAFQKAAKQYPDNVAAVFKDKKYTYKELDELTDRIGSLIYSKLSTNALPREGRGGVPVVSILIPRNEYMFILPLAAMKAGCAYQPLDPSYPGERLNFMVKDADAALLIADPELRPIINEYNGEVLLTSELEDTGSDPVICRDLSRGLTPDGLLILLYTSGSTGVPKGVMLEHRNVMAYVRWYQQNYNMTSESVTAAYASFGFDANMMDMYPTLTVGGTLHIVPEEIRLDIVALQDFMNDNKVTIAFMTNQVAQQFILNADNLTTLQHIGLGGEKMMALTPPKGLRVHNLYGPTECSVAVTHYEVTDYEQNIPIGSPTMTSILWIMDKNGHRVPAGAPGELWVSGLQVGRGYLNRPEKTAEVFLKLKMKNEKLIIADDNDPDAMRTYRTGDIVRYRQDGNIEFIGRKDGQVKIRGFRIELKEVEAVIRDFQGITDVTVQAFDDPNGGKFIAAYVVSGKEVDINALNDFISDRKPSYMVPAVTMQIEKIPLNVNQKVDKKALPKPELGTGAGCDVIIAPQNDLQREIKAIIAGIVNTEEFGITDVLGFVGLTSLASIMLAARIFKKYGVQVDTRTLPKTATIQSIEEEINAHAGNKTELETYERFSEAPLTHSQQGVYVECVINADSVVYNIPIALNIPAGITVEQLEKALRDFVKAHPYINSRFVLDADDNTIQQQITDFELDIPVKELTAEELEDEKKAFVRPFNLSEGPLYRFEIIKIVNHKSLKCILLIDFHHLIADGGSIDLFLRQLSELLDGANIEAECYDYYNFAHDQKISDETEAFYESMLSQVEEASALLPDVYDSDDSHVKAYVSVPTCLNNVAERCKALGITPAAFYLAATMITVSKYAAEETVGICTISSGRANSRIAEAMGMFVNTLPIVSNVNATQRVDDYLVKVADIFANTIANEDYPFARIAEKYNYAANIMYAYQVGVIDKYMTKYGEMTFQFLELDLAKFPVYISINGDDTVAHINVEYDTSLFSAEMMRGLAMSVDTIVCELLSKEKLADVEVCCSEQIAVLDTFNHPIPEIEEETILAAFRKVAKQYPDNVAAVFKDKKYTYKELDELTDRIAITISEKRKAKSEKCEPVVSILIPRNEYMFILPLAAMKAGCAYQPLDPSYPQERLNFMVKDADAAVLIADPELRDIINEYQGEVILTSELVNLPTSEPQNLRTLQPNSLLILLYTSGSTGVPKGVMLEHGNLIAFCNWCRRYYDLKPEHNVAAYSSFGFDVCMMDLFSALTTGATVYIIPEELRLDLAALNEYFEANDITHGFFTTQVGVQFLMNTENHSLLHLSVAGEKLVSVDPANGYILHNVYGPTETFITTSLPVLKNEKNIPIGKPIDSLNCYVVDKNLHRLPIGAAGELIIVGPQVGRGYLNRPDKTAEAFFTWNGQRAYHSGDIVRYREDGNLEFIGRKDGQVKIRGFRIELKEVEAVIRDFQGITDVTVQAFDDPNGGKFIAAYVVSDEEVDINALNDFISDRKPSYMVPAVTMQIEKIPLNVNQKVDKKALPKPEINTKRIAAPVKKATNAIEQRLCDAFCEVLQTNEVSIDDDFFQIGGDSLKVLRLSVICKDIKLNSRDVFRYKTPRKIAAALENKEAETDLLQLPESVPLTETQQGIFVDCMNHRGNPIYHIARLLRLPKEIDTKRLCSALERSVYAHPGLFAEIFVNPEGVMSQRKGSIDGFGIQVEEMSEEEFERAKAKLISYRKLTNTRLFKIRVIQTPSSVYLFTDFHHIIFDGDSEKIFFKHVESAYLGADIAVEQFTPYHVSLLESVRRESSFFEECKQWYIQHYGAVACTSLPQSDLVQTDDEDEEDDDPASVLFKLSRASSENLTAAAQKLGITKNVLAVTAFGIALNRINGTETAAFTTIYNGRDDYRFSSIVSMFVKTLPVVVCLREENLFEVVKTQLNESITHSLFSFADLCHCTSFDNRVSFVYQNGYSSMKTLCGYQCDSIGLNTHVSNGPLLILLLDEGSLKIRTEYQNALFSEGRITDIVNTFDQVLEEIINKTIE